MTNKIKDDINTTIWVYGCLIIFGVSFGVSLMLVWYHHNDNSRIGIYPENISDSNISIAYFNTSDIIQYTYAQNVHRFFEQIKLLNEFVNQTNCDPRSQSCLGWIEYVLEKKL